MLFVCLAGVFFGLSYERLGVKPDGSTLSVPEGVRRCKIKKAILHPKSIGFQNITTLGSACSRINTSFYVLC